VFSGIGSGDLDAAYRTRFDTTVRCFDWTACVVRSAASGETALKIASDNVERLAKKRFWRGCGLGVAVVG